MLKASVSNDHKWARCIVKLSDEVYITDTKDIRNPDHSFIEAVSFGQVRRRLITPTQFAPEEIVKLMHNFSMHKGF